MRRFLSFTIALSIMFINTLSINAIESTIMGPRDLKVSPVKNKYEYINLEWWQGFNDDVLNDYIVKAIENNKDLKMATLTIDEFYQNVAMQRAGELPLISSGFMPNYGNLGGKTHESFGFPIIASYELDLLGKNHNKTASAKKLYEVSVIDERAAYIGIASAVGTTYINIVRFDSLIDMQTDIVALRKEIYDIMSISNAEGIASTSDLVKANQSYIIGVSELTELKKERTKLLHQLAVLTGDSPNNIEEYKRSDWKQLSYVGNIPEYVSSEVIMQRPDYLKAEKMLEKAGIDVKIARKEYFPSLNLGGGVLFKSKNIGSLFTTSNALWGLGGGIMQTIFAGGQIRANLKSKKTAYEKSLKNYEKVNLTSMQEVNDTLVSVNFDKEKLAKQLEIQKLEKKDFELSGIKYREGIISKLDLSQKKENLMNVDKMVYSSQFDCMIDYINYYKAVGAKA